MSKDFGPLEELLHNPGVMSIEVNGPGDITGWHASEGRIMTSAKFRDAAHLREVIDAILASAGASISEGHPRVEARLSDGSTVIASIPPASDLLTLRISRAGRGVDEPNFGPLEELLENPKIMDIMINGPDSIYAWHLDEGRIQITNTFRDAAHLREIMDRVLASAGTSISEDRPLVDLRLIDGSTVLAMIPPVSITGPVMHIARTVVETMTMERLVELKSISAAAAQFLIACVKARQNIIAYGGFSSGKNTILNVLAHHIPEQARVIAIHNVGDDTLRHHNRVVLETVPADLNGKGINVRQLLDTALKMGPDRLLLGATEGPEIATLLNIMSIGYTVMAVMDGINPRDVISRLETMATAASASTPLLTIREQIARGVNLLVSVELMQDGLRRVNRISEVSHELQGNNVITNDLFVYEWGKGLVPTGSLPENIDALEGIDRALFQVAE